MKHGKGTYVFSDTGMRVFNINIILIYIYIIYINII